MIRGLALAAELAATAAAADPVFLRLQDPALGHRYTGGWEHFVGGGVAVFDCDGDALPELYVAGGSTPAQLLRNRSDAGGLRFAVETPPALSLTGVTGAYPLDIDSDGLMDLAILRVGPNVLMRGLPDCAFAPFDPGLDRADRWTTAFSATWERGAAWPTLAFGNYVDRTDPKGPFQACDQNTLYRPSGNGYGSPVALTPGFCALSILFSDWGRRGRQDLRVSNDRHYYVRDGAEQLWAIDPVPRLYTAAEGWRPVSIWGMGIASRDLTGDGLPEIFLTSMGDQKLQSLSADPARPTYSDAPFDKGITAHRPHVGEDGRPSTGWHAAFGDVDNDGRDDLFIAKGNVEAMPGNAMEDPNNLLIQRADGTFAERGDTAGIASTARSRGAALVDLVVVNRNAPLEIYRNLTPVSGHWLLLRTRQSAPNVDAVGAWIEVRTGQRTQSREIVVGGGHAGGAAGFEHFGLGAARDAMVRVIWPDGARSDWQPVAPDRRYLLQRIGSDGAFALR